MDIKKMNSYRKSRIAFWMLLVMMLELCAPFIDSTVTGMTSMAYAGSPTPVPDFSQDLNSTNVNNTAKNIYYQTEAYNFALKDANGNLIEESFLGNASSEKKADGTTMTNHTITKEEFQAWALYGDGKNVDWQQYFNPDTGTYDILSQNTLTVHSKDGGEIGKYTGTAESDQMREDFPWTPGSDYRLGSDDPSINPLMQDWHIPADWLPTATPVPTNTPMPTAEPQISPIISVTNTPTPIITISPTPTITVTPSPTPTITLTPVPTQEPREIEYVSRYEYYKYYTTTNGYSISDFTVKAGNDNGVMKGIASYNGSYVISLADAIANAGKRTAYTVATDASGNEWYIIPSTSTSSITGLGSVYTATSVHPKTYNGNSVDGAGIKNITTLVFPDYVTASGRTYYVTGIGGSGAYYYADASTVPSGTVSRDFGSIQGSYSWKSGKNTREFTYLLGCVGSGTITSDGHYETSTVNYNTYCYYYTYKTNYYVYNTSLGSITIPKYCTTIEDYAFHNCQALTVINGGAGLKTIGKHAFSVTEPPELKRSYKTDEYSVAWNPNYITEIIYSYNESYSTRYSDYPVVMRNFQDVVTLNRWEMEFPALPVLATVGESAFEGRYHIRSVELPDTITAIHKNAFKGCKLEDILIPCNGAVYGDYETLGTKGRDVALLTLVRTPTDSNAYNYAITYDEYYRVAQDVYIQYHPNGGTPNTAVKEYQEVKYAKPTFGDTFFTFGENGILWLNEDGKINTATANGNTITGGLYRAMSEYQYTAMERFEITNTSGIYSTYIYLIGTLTNGSKHLIQVTPAGVVSVYATWNPPAKMAYGTFVTVDASNTVLVCTGTDGRYHWLQNGTWTSETAWPGTVAKASNTESNKLPYHNVILCSDNTVYIKTSINATWIQLQDFSTKVPQYFDEISADGYYVYKYSSSNTYMRYTITRGSNYAYANNSSAVNVTKSGNAMVYNGSSYELATGLESGPDVLEKVTLNYNHSSTSTTYNGSTSSSSGRTVTEATIKQDENTKAITAETYYQKTELVNGNSTGADRESEATLDLGSGELLGLRMGASGESAAYASYYLASDGYIYRKTDTGGTTKVSSTRFVKVVPLTELIAPLSYWKEQSEQRQTVSGSYGGSTSTSSMYSDSTWSGGTSSPSYVNVAALDTEGHLWYGEFIYYSYNNIVENLTKVDSRTYTDIVAYNNSVTSTQSSGGYDSVTTTTNTIEFFAMDTAKDVYRYSGNSKIHVHDRSYTSDANSTSNTDYFTITYYSAEDFTLTNIAYEKDADKFIGYPYILLDEGTLGLLTTPDAELDIFCGIEVLYRVSKNRWFINAGKKTEVWNTKANGSGTERVPSDTPNPVIIWDADWNAADYNWDLYAQWKSTLEDPRYVRYDANGGYGMMAATTVPAGSTKFTVGKNKFTRDGFGFLYFTDNPEGNGTRYYPENEYDYTWTSPYIVLYAQWELTYTVEFADDEIRLNSYNFYMTYDEVEYDEVIRIPEEPKEKKVWVDYRINTNSSMSTAALAKWVTAQPLSEKYRLSRQKFLGWDKYFPNAGGGYTYDYYRYPEMVEVSGLADENNAVVYMFPIWGGLDAYVELPEVACPGYDLFGWIDTPKAADATEIAWYSPDLGEIYYKPTTNKTLYAWWEPCKYKINLVQTMDGEAPDVAGDASVTMTFDKECPAVVAPKMEHYVFAGYFTEPEGKGVKYYDRADKITSIAEAYEDKLWQIYDGSVDTLYAHWIPDMAITYEANYSPVSPENDADYYTPWIEYIVTNDNTWTLAENIFTRTGHDFKNWNTRADGSGTAFSDKETIDTSWIEGSITLYAQWEPHTITMVYAPDSIGENPPVPTPGPEDVWVYNRIYTIRNRPFDKYDTVAYELNRGDKSTVPELVTALTEEHTRALYPYTRWQLYEKTGTGLKNMNKFFPEGYRVLDNVKGNGRAFVMFPVWEEVPTGVTLPVAQCIGYDFLGWTENATDDGELVGSVLASPYVTNRTASGTYSYETVNGYAYKILNQTLYACWTPKQYEVILDDRGATSTGHTESVIMTFDKDCPSIIVPEKTGYVFNGYYTEIKGSGTKYYNADGTSAKTWTETDVYVLYAYWTQKPVELPEEDEHVDPVAPGEEDLDGQFGRSDTKALLYADDYNDATGALTDLQPYLTYDTPASEGVIPGTEYVSFRAKFSAWMLNYQFYRHSGTKTVKYMVTVPYRTQYEDGATEELVISEEKTKTYEVLIPKVWSYWEVVSSGMYYPDKVTLYNDAFKEESIEVTVDRTGDTAAELPSYEAKKYGAEKNHVKWPEYDTDGTTPVFYITLEEAEYIISERPDTLPDIDLHLGIVCRNAAWADTRQAEVRSDRFKFNGETILSDAWQSGHGASLDETKLPKEEDIAMTSYEQTYKSGIELDELKPNGTYETTAVITYTGDEDNIGTPATKDVELDSINDLNIHTPVACDGVITDGVEYKEDETGEEHAVLTLKEALNFFTLRIDNTGTHRMSLGYGAKDFRYALSGKSNVAEKDGSLLNQVKFPFDVYVDMGNNSRNADGTYNTTGDYFIEAGTWLTIGGEEKTFYVPVTQKNGMYWVDFRTIAVNFEIYVEEVDTMKSYVQQYANTEPENYIASTMQELTIQSYLRNFLITGTDDSYAEMQRKQGNQALVLKKGYQYSFELLSQGEFYGENTKLCITPSFFWVSEDETEREEVILYAETYQAELKPRECYKWEGIPLLEQHQFHEVILQRFSGTGYLPEDVLCVPVSLHQEAEEYMKRETITGKEKFFRQTGYLVVHFDIKLRSEEGGWYSFDHWENTGIYRDAVAAEWNYIPGDVIRYDLSKSISDDYEVGGIE